MLNQQQRSEIVEVLQMYNPDLNLAVGDKGEILVVTGGSVRELASQDEILFGTDRHSQQGLQNAYPGFDPWLNVQPRHERH
ncbi:hypothetical protein K2Y11_14110 [bacterium]|nr:hypothetical protein [bacterium]